jgi:hypothetical protein
MADDPLAQYRKTPLPPKGAMIPPVEADEYAAFGTKDKVFRLQIRGRNDSVNSPGYNILLNVTHDGKRGTFIILVYTVLMVFVQGRNLQRVVYAIENGMADFIQEFDPEIWEKPEDETKAFIESIEVKVTSGSATIETEH